MVRARRAAANGPDGGSNNALLIGSFIYVVIVGIAIGALIGLTQWDKDEARVLYVPVSMFEAGIFGQLAAILYQLTTKPGQVTINENGAVPVLARPLLGALFGAVTYLVGVVGDLALNLKGEPDALQVLVIAAFLAGFKPDYFLTVLDKFTGRAPGGKGPSQLAKISPKLRSAKA